MKRLKILKYGLLVAVGIICLRLFFIQIIEHSKWVELAQEQQTMQHTIVAERGTIYMMDGEEPVEIVMNEPVWTILVDPMLADAEETERVVDQHAAAQRVAEWKDVFADRERRYYIVARGVKREAAEKIKAEGLTGVWFQEGVRRVYPEGQMASGLLGFVNADGVGQYGVEGALNEDLAGKNGVLKTVKDVNNIPLTIGDDNVRVPAENGKNIVLSIDRNIQRRVEIALQHGLERAGATHASGLVMDPRTGKIWAMANLPTYDAQNYALVEDATVFQNGVVEDAYEPASVCKTFAFAAAVDSGAMTPDTTYINTGSTEVDGWPIQNAHQGHEGSITMQTALTWSLNTGSIQALRLMGGSTTEITYQGKEVLFDYYYNHFGLGQYTGIELFESSGLIVPPDSTGLDASNSRYANMTFGQGLNVTMMQVAAGFSALVNGGEYYTPTIIEGEMVNGKLVSKPMREPVRQVVSVGTSATMRDMIWTARQLYKNFGYDPAGYKIGGKTGTSQAVKNGEYTFDETLANYIGFGGSADDEVPEYVIMVKIWREGTQLDGERHAMPIFTEISNYMIDYLKIKPSGV